ncbi:DNA-processing protein DprA [Alloscardovia venturai]|uniref:DNA-processing protein DprA n=1 Tax=Alloscardovia venturai TaxID=1769421 RepID=A0ABW2Y3G9_9BIFI
MSFIPKPSLQATSRGLLTLIANGSDPVMSHLIHTFENGDVVKLVHRLQELAILYERSFMVPDYNDLSCLLRKQDEHGSLMRALDKCIVPWLIALRPYAHMSFSALSCTLTQNYNYWLICPHESCWPEQFSDLPLHTDEDVPLCLWGLGDMHALVSCPEPISIVGSRNVDAYGRTTAFNAAKSAANHGHLVISGGAMGTDAAAHWGAISADENSHCAGRTIAIMAGGLNHIGPARNATLFQRIQEYDGAIISELPPNVIPEPYRFLKRNRLIAAMSSVTLIAQAQHRSGALNTATWAADLNRTVVAAPGNINTPYNTGCNRLIYDGKASILVSAHSLEDFCHSPHERLMPSTDIEINPPQPALLNQ